MHQVADGATVSGQGEVTQSQPTDYFAELQGEQCGATNLDAGGLAEARVHGHGDRGAHGVEGACGFVVGVVAVDVIGAPEGDGSLVVGRKRFQAGFNVIVGVFVVG